MIPTSSPPRNANTLNSLATAAGCGGMLSDEDRVVPHRSLLAVIRWIGGGETLLNEFLTVRHHGVQPLALQVFPFSGTKPESATEGGASQLLENFTQIAVHRRSPLRQALVIELAHVVRSLSLDSSVCSSITSWIDR